MLDWLFADPLLPGTPAPDFSLPDQDGKPASLSALRGHNVVLVFYPGDDTSVCRQQLCAFRDRFDPVTAAGEILEGGAKILQFRHKGFFSREVFAQLERIAGLCREANALFVVNDRADLAALTGAALHLGQDDLPPSAARKVVGADTLIGFSTHNERHLRAAAADPA